MKRKLWGKDKKETQGLLTLIGSALAFSLMTLCIKQTQSRIPIFELIFFRSVFSLLITRLMMKNADVYPWGKNKKLLLTRGLVGTGAVFCVFKAVDSLPLAAATIIQYTYPTFTALLAWAILREIIRKRIILSIILGWIGVQIVVNPLWTNNSNHQILPSSAIMIALLGSILTALAYVIVRKLSKDENQLVIVFYFPLVSIPLTIPFMLQDAVQPKSIDWIWILGIGVFTQLGQLLITRGLSLLPAGYAGSINYTQVLFATLWGSVFFSEPLTLYLLIGAGCVLGATLIAVSELPGLQ